MNTNTQKLAMIEAWIERWQNGDLTLEDLGRRTKDLFLNNRTPAEEKCLTSDGE